MRGWASSPLDTDSSRLLSSVEQGLTVGLIATPKPKVCGVRDDLQAVIEREDLQTFDYVPVKNGDRMVGLLHRSGDKDASAKSVAEVMQPLHGGMLISSDSGILSYIERADEHEYTCRLVLYGDRLDGIVTLSDLQKLPVRPALFMLVTHVELLMAQWIRSSGVPDEKILSRLPEERKRRAEEEWNRLRKNNLSIDRLTATQFCDKRHLLLGLDFVHGKKQKDDAENDLDDIEHLLRNPIAHAGEFAPDEERALELVAAVRTARAWIDRLERAIENRSRNTES